MQAEEGPSSRLAAKLLPRRALVQPQAPPPFLSACFSQDVAPKTSGGRPPAARTWLTASSSLQLLLLHSQASPPDEGDGRGAGALGQASGPGAAPLALVHPAWSALAPFGAPEQDVEPAAREPRGGAAVRSRSSP